MMLRIIKRIIIITTIRRRRRRRKVITISKYFFIYIYAISLYNAIAYCLMPKNKLEMA